MSKVNWIDLDKGKMSGNEFFDSLLEFFPNMKDEFQDCEGDEIHYKMERFSDYTNKQIKENNQVKVKECFDFIEDKLDLINSDLENVYVVR